MNNELCLVTLVVLNKDNTFKKENLYITESEYDNENVEEISCQKLYKKYENNQNLDSILFYSKND